MDENYIPGFTNHLYSSSGMTPYGDYYDPSMYSDAMVSPYGRMAGDYYDPSVYSEPSYGIDPYGRMAGEQVGMPQAVEPVSGLDIMGGGGRDMTLARPSALSNAATASPYVKPSLTPSLDFVTNNGQQGYYFVTNAGKRAKTKANPTAFVAVDPNATYRLVNERGKNAIATSGMGEQGLRDAYAMAQQLSAQGGKKADWYLERSDPNGNWTRIADDDPKGSDLGTFGKVLGMALPIATAFIPGLNALGMIAVQAASGAAGSALAGGDPLKGAVIGGLTAGGGALGSKFLAPALDVSTKLGTAIGTGLGSTAGNLVTGNSLKNSLLSGVTSGGLSYIAPDVLDKLGIKTAGGGDPSGGGSGSPGSTYTPEGGWNISGGTSFSPAPAVGIGSSGGSSKYEPVDYERIDVIGTPTVIPTPVTLPTGGGSPLDGIMPQPDSSLIEQPAEEPVDYERIDVIGAPTVIPTPVTLPTGGGSPLDGVVPQPDSSLVDDKSTLEDIADYLRLAGLASSVLGGVFGGGGSGSGSKFNVPAGMGALSSVFSSKLPTANIPGGVGTGGTGARTAADLAGQGLRDPKDYYRYGYGPAQSFFNYVPQGAPNTSQAYTGYAEGGFAVEGAGDGRDDKIPALLSDGEYVIDAETVALLGNGSNKAGAELLDQFRVNVRKQKGRKLAKGEFSEDAKRPEHYMAGGYA